MHFGTGAGLSYQMETLVKRGIISPRVREQMLDTLTASNTLGLKRVSHQEKLESPASSTSEKDSVVGLYHGSLTSNSLL